MSSEYFEAEGEVVQAHELKLQKSKELVSALSQPDLPYVRLVECRRIPGQDSETIVLELEVERGQVLAYDIRDLERISVTFSRADVDFPEVLALRKNFPLVPHINLRPKEFPRSLCLYEVPYAEAKTEWTPLRFVERIREWLALTSKGRLHGADQPLEPLLAQSTAKLIYPPEILTEEDAGDPILLEITGVQSGERFTLFADKAGSKERDQGRVALKGVAVAFVSEPVVHGPIRRETGTFGELSEFCASAGLNLLGELRRRFSEWQRSGQIAGRRDHHLFLLITFPIQRTANGPIEAFGTWAFQFTKRIKEIGAEIGVWSFVDGNVGTLLSIDETKNGSGLPLLILDPVHQFSADRASHLNGELERIKTRVLAVGLGALGSLVFANLFRSAFGEWTLVDNDILLPHNLAKHYLSGPYVGFSKAEAMASIANSTITGPDIARFEVQDVLQHQNLGNLLTSADLVLDMSASVAVARRLALDAATGGRRVSIFISPSGLDLVMIAESANRELRLDHLEYQYYRAVSRNGKLKGHLTAASGRARYARSCRDVTSTLPHNFVAMHAAIAAGGIKTLVNEASSQIIVWRIEEHTFQVARVDVQPAPVRQFNAGDWTIFLDEALIREIQTSRRAKLPNETGGVLLGAVDTSRRAVYISDILSSPADSVERPVSYVRGVAGLANRMLEIQKETLGRVSYVGEWHSHPEGHSSMLSAEDRSALAVLTSQMSAEQMPALMLIVGEGEDLGFYLGTIKDGPA